MSTPYPEVAAEIRAIGPQIEVPRTAQLYRDLHAIAPPAGIAITRDLRYGPHERHALDVFTWREAPRAPLRPVVVFLHGGGFRGGAKKIIGGPCYDNIGIWAAGAGLVGITMNYRLAPEFMYPSGVEDLELALAQVRALAADFGGDARRLFVWGHSAGAAHAADFIAARPEASLAGAILTSGIYEKSGGAASPWSVYYGEDSARQTELSSVPALVATHVPLLVTWAELDRADFIAEAEALVAARERAGHAVATLLLPGHSHISEIYAVGTADTSLTAPVLDFIRTTSGGLS